MGHQYAEAKKRRFEAAIAKACPSELYPTERRRTRIARRWRPSDEHPKFNRWMQYHNRDYARYKHRVEEAARLRTEAKRLRDEALREKERQQAEYVEMVLQKQPSATTGFKRLSYRRRFWECLFGS